MEKESWLPVIGYEGVYEVSNIGRVKRILKGQGTKTGIIKQADRRVNMKVELCINGVQKTHYVHHLVLYSFVGPMPEGLECCHNDGNYKNNRLNNLRWDTRKSNVADSIRHGTFKRLVGEMSPISKLKDCDIKKIRQLLDKGNTLRFIAKMFGVYHSCILNIKKGKTWKHVK